MEISDLPLPQSYEQAEQLVQKFYQPGSPKDLQRIDRCLKQMQRSDQGFGLADALLGSRDAHVRFFGALTFVVKVNCDWDKLNPQQEVEMLQRLLNWLVQMVEGDGGSLVIRKLCSALVAVFVQTGGTWRACTHDVIWSLAARQPVVEVSTRDDVSRVCEDLESRQLLTALWFATTLIEEVGKMDPDTARSHMFSKALRLNIPDAIKLIRSGVERQGSGRVQCVTESVRSLHSLLSVMVALGMGIKDKERPDQELQQLMMTVLDLLKSSVFFDVVVEMALDVLDDSWIFHDTEFNNTIWNNIRESEGVRRFADLVSGSNDPDALALLRIYIACAKGSMSSSNFEPQEEHEQFFFQEMLQVTRRPGVAVAEDEAAVEVLEFWAFVGEWILGYFFGSPKDGEAVEGATEVQLVLQEAIVALLEKIALPPTNIMAEWDSTLRSEFQSFRRDFQDFLTTVYSIFGPTLFGKFGDHALGAGVRRDWAGTEAGLYAIIGLGDAASDSSEIDEYLKTLFGSLLWSELVKPDSSASRSTISTAVSLVAAYQSFFRRHPQSLEPTIGFLFRCLESQSPGLGQTAAKTISALCDACREVLAPHAQSFASQYNLFVHTGQRDFDVKQKLIGGVAAVVQAQAALPDPNARDAASQSLHDLLLLIEREINATGGIDDVQEAWERNCASMRSLTSLGKGYRVPDSAPINLEEESPVMMPQETEWLRISRGLIANLCERMLERFPYDGEMMDSVCDVLRAGIPESTGPFVMPLQLVDRILGPPLLMTSKPGAAFETIARILRKRKAESTTPEVQAFAAQYLKGAAQLVAGINGDPSADTEKAASAVDFLQALIPEFLSVLCLPDPEVRGAVRYLWRFAVECLTSNEILPRRSACSLWTAALEHRPNGSPGSDALEAAVKAMGARIAQILVNDVGGNVPRSELDPVVVPLKKMIIARREAQAWLEAALSDRSFPNTKIPDSDKRIFLKTILSLRGSSKTNQVVKDFWVRCRGTFVT